MMCSYLPEFLENRNRFNYGNKLTGEEIGDVHLPPWASDAKSFIAIHRQVIEFTFLICKKTYPSTFFQGVGV